MVTRTAPAGVPPGTPVPESMRIADVAPSASTRRLRLALAGLALFAPALAAQDLPTGKITGRVVDAATGQGIPAAGVQVVGTTIGAQSGVDGRFTILRVPRRGRAPMRLRGPATR